MFDVARNADELPNSSDQCTIECHRISNVHSENVIGFSNVRSQNVTVISNVHSENVTWFSNVS